MSSDTEMTPVEQTQDKQQKSSIEAYSAAAQRM